MASTGELKVTTPTDREIVMTRIFDAPRSLVFDAYTKPELLKRWLYGPDGWMLSKCEVDLKIGGKYRYVWRHTDGREMGMGGHLIGRLFRPSVWLRPRYSTKTGRAVRRWGRSLLPSKPAKRLSRKRCSTRQERLATARSGPAWSMASLRASTGLRACWHR